MFGSVGPTELLLIFVIALLVFGPKKLPEIGKSVGKALREFKKASEEIKGRIEDEIQASELKDVHKDVKDGLNTLQSGMRGFQDRLKQTMGLDEPLKPATPSYYTPPETSPAVETPASGTESPTTSPADNPYAALGTEGTRQDIPQEAGSLKDDIKKDTTKNGTGEGQKVS